MKRFGFLIRYGWVLALVWLGGMTLLLAPREARPSAEENRMLAAAPTLSIETVWDGSFMTDTETWLSDGVILRDQMIGISKTVDACLSMPKDDTEEALELIDAIEAEMNGQPTETAKTAAPTEAPTPAPQTSPAAPNATEAAQIIAEPTETPVLSETAFWVEYGDGRTQTLYTFPAANVLRAAQALNAYRDVLPNDGRVIFLQSPVASMGNGYLKNLSRSPVWHSTMEDALQSVVKDGVLIVNAAEAMNEPLSRGEYVYFRTDHHWTARGAYTAYRAVMERLGVPAADYDDYAYSVKNGMRGNNANNGAKSDTIEVMYELLPTESYVVSHLDQSRQISLMDYDTVGYLAFLHGTQKPWRRFETGAQTGRTALLIGDSYANAFLPYLLPHYDRVMMTDLRYTSYKPEDAGASVSAYIEAYGVDDVYFVFCLATGINSSFFTDGQITRYLH